MPCITFQLGAEPAILTFQVNKKGAELIGVFFQKSIFLLHAFFYLCPIYGKATHHHRARTVFADH